MLISNTSVYNNAQSFETPRKNNYGATAPGAHIVWEFIILGRFRLP